MFLDILFPNRCLNCNTLIHKGELVCYSCMRHIDFAHYTSETDNVLYQKCQLLFPTRSAHYLMNYSKGGLSQNIIHQLKYHNRKNIGKTLAEWAVDRMSFNENLPDILVPVPLHVKKERQRGYNQLHIFMEVLSRNLNVSYDHTLLKRNKHKKAQALQSKIHRTQNMGMFSLTKPIENKHIMIIDDVFTTGNTLGSMAWELLKSSSNTISVLIMALD